MNTQVVSSQTKKCNQRGKNFKTPTQDSTNTQTLAKTQPLPNTQAHANTAENVTSPPNAQLHHKTSILSPHVSQQIMFVLRHNKEFPMKVILEKPFYS